MANYVDITPIMTGNMGTGGYKSSASTVNGELSAWRAFDSQTTTSTSECIWHSAGGMPQWIMLEFPEAVQVDMFSVQNRPDTGNAAAKGITAFQLQGSNNGSSFDTLGTYTSDGAIGATKQYTVTSPGEYKYYRVYITAAGYSFSGTQYALVEQIRFYSLAGESMGGNVNIGGVRHTLPNGYVNIGGVARKLLEGYANIDGVVHLLYKGVPTPEEPASRLPSGYKEVEYIESSGMQYIDTGFKPKGSTRVVADHESFSVASGYPTVFGARDSGGGGGFVCHYSANTKLIYWYYGSNTPSLEVSNPWGRHVVDFNQNKLYRDGVLISTQTLQSFTSIVNLYLFVLKYGATVPSIHQCKMRLYSCQIYDNGTLVRDFVPCKNPSGAVGLFDLVNSVFYGNIGSGSFTAGAEV